MKNNFKTIGIHKNNVNKCDIVVEIVNVNKTQYTMLQEECKEVEAKKELKEEKLYKAISEMQSEIETLKKEIKVLKGEE